MPATAAALAACTRSRSSCAGFIASSWVGRSLWLEIRSDRLDIYAFTIAVRAAACTLAATH